MKFSIKESYNYRDPITELVECLYVNFDFDGAQVKLRKCDQVKKNLKLCSFVLFSRMK
jgi:translation initiation factor 3 subunit E